MTRVFRITTDEAIERTRHNLKMEPGSVVDLNSLHLSAKVHPWTASDGSRYSNYDAMVDREAYLKYVNRQRLKAESAAVFAVCVQRNAIRIS